MRPSSSFRGMHEHQFFSFDDPVGRLVIDLNIEGPNETNFIPSGMGEQGVGTGSTQQVAQCFGCGKKRRTPESDDIDLNEIPNDDDEDDEDYCTCENPPLMLGTGGMNNQLHAGSSSRGVIRNQQGQSSAAAGGGQGTEIRVVASSEAVENNRSNGGGRSRRARMRGTPRRVLTSTVEAGSSSEIPTYEEPPITILPNVDPTFVSVAPPVTTVNGATPFRIRDIVSRQDNNVLRTFGSGVEVHRYRSHPSGTRGTYTLTIGQSSHGQNPPTSQPHQQISNLQPSINSQTGNSLTSNVAQNLIVNPTQLVEQRPQTAASTFGDGLNQRQFVGPMIQFMPSGANRGEVRPNFQSTNGNMQPSATRVDLDGRIPHRHLLLQQGLHLQLMHMGGGEIGDVLPGVEEMTYEQLSALGERIGIVNTGLTEEVIQQRLRNRYYRAPQNRAPPEEAESCCICLVDFVNRDVLGRINCLHKFHFDCIKKWLLEKNFCPLCKQTALEPPNE